MDEIVKAQERLETKDNLVNGIAEVDAIIAQLKKAKEAVAGSK